MSRPVSWAELWGSLPQSTRDAITASVASAPPFPPETCDVLRRVFAGSGEQILARREAAAKRDAA